MMEKEEIYECESCGKTVTVSDGKVPECCNKPMKKVSLEICLQPVHAENARSSDEDDACDDFRAG